MSVIHVEIPLESFPPAALKRLKAEALQKSIGLDELIVEKTLQVANEVVNPSGGDRKVSSEGKR